MPYQRVHKDSQGRELAVGQKVAYNMSGDVVPGEITNLGAEIRILYKGNLKFYDYDYSNGYPPTKTEQKPRVSRVRNGTSVLLLEQPSS
jgi:hypothetical protein